MVILLIIIALALLPAALDVLATFAMLAFGAAILIFTGIFKVVSMPFKVVASVFKAIPLKNDGLFMKKPIVLYPFLTGVFIVSFFYFQNQH